jgi:Ni,Fe-hydrogenase III large subunit
MNNCWEGILPSTAIECWEERDRWEANQDYLVFRNNGNLLANCQQFHDICQRLRERSAYLVTMAATDERFLEDGCYKLRYVFSHQVKDHFLILEYPLSKHVPPTGSPENGVNSYLQAGACYPSIRDEFKAAIPFERKIFDLVGLVAVSTSASGDAPPASSQTYVTPIDAVPEHAPGGFLLHYPYPPHLHPLAADKRTEDIVEEIEYYAVPAGQIASKRDRRHVENVMPVGPIHAGVIEAGHFSFYIAGEVVDDLDIQLGFKHKGIEKLFQTKFSLLDGWQMAERISGDSSFSHSLAYCYAVEALAHIEIPLKATLLRGFLLEMERLYNHIGDTGALAKDVAFDLVASEISVIREYLVRLYARLTGHRFLRGVNRPGGAVLPLCHEDVFNQQHIDKLAHEVSFKRFSSLESMVEAFGELGELLIRTPAFRDRAINTGKLTENQARDIGATGLAARASGIRERDFRVNHPSGIYNLEQHPRKIVDLQARLQEQGELIRPRMSGDVFARLDMRLHEVNTSLEVIKYILEGLEITTKDELIAPHIEEAVKIVPNYEFALGYVEGWRGDIVYWIMKDRFNKIFRCEARDPSFLNWPALRLAIIPDDPSQADETGNILPDFPVINKSFNLSYSGHDG